ncbi:MAG: CPBP family intramembrane glutamic endopeptidase [Anaerolineales bacterium]
MTTPTDENRTQPSILRRIFFEPFQVRLRSGWRLLLHTILTIFLLFFFSALITLLGTSLGLAEIDVSDPAQLNSPLLLLGPLIGITAATWIARRWLDRRSFQSLGFAFDELAIRDLLFGILMPAALFALIFLFEWIVGWLQVEGTAFSANEVSSPIGPFLSAAVTFIIVGYQEELLSRGYHLQNLIEGTNIPIGLFISSGIFALLHAANPGASVLSTLGILLAGYFLAFGWLRTGQLWLPIGLHIGWNFFQGTVFGFRVSGTSGFSLIRHSVDGPRLITGGAFGPEAGLVGFVAMALGAAAIWWYTQGRETELRPEPVASEFPHPGETGPGH